MDTIPMPPPPPPPPSSTSTSTHHSSNVHLNKMAPILLLILGFILGYLMHAIQVKNTVRFGALVPTPSPVILQQTVVTQIPTPVPVATILFPNTNATLCLGKSYSIRWEAPANVQTVALNLYGPAGLPHQITDSTQADTDAQRGSMIQGSYIWKAGENLDKVTIKEGPGYRIGLTTYTSGELGGRFSIGDTFTLTKCQN